MKFHAFLILATAATFLIAIITRVSAQPLDKDVLDEESLEQIHARMRRATCDLLSFSSQWVTPNHAGCAAHCILLGKKGGSCKNTICYCRN